MQDVAGIDKSTMTEQDRSGDCSKHKGSKGLETGVIDLPAANRRFTPPKRRLVASALRLHLRGKTPKEEKRDETCMSFRWYCPDQVLTVISQNETCAFGGPKARDLEHPPCVLHKKHLPCASMYGCRITILYPPSAAWKCSHRDHS
jgi:hypothetical protein